MTFWLPSNCSHYQKCWRWLWFSLLNYSNTSSCGQVFLKQSFSHSPQKNLSHISTVLTFELTILSIWFILNRNLVFLSKKEDEKEVTIFKEGHICGFLNILLVEFWMKYDMHACTAIVIKWDKCVCVYILSFVWKHWNVNKLIPLVQINTHTRFLNDVK